MNNKADGKEAAEALELLDKCCTNDKRKYIHLDRFAECCLRFYELHESDMHDVAMNYIHKAIEHIEIGVDDGNLSLTKKNKKKLRHLKSKLLKCG